MNENLAKKIETGLSPEAVGLLKRASQMAAGRGEKLYLVGGAVRDILLGRQTLDIDLVIEGDAVGLAQALAGEEDMEIIAHRQFGTARLDWRGLTVDLATARTETYPRPGALPAVSPGGIDEDLFRRDFTINAMAVSLNPGDYGLLFDPYNGQGDLSHGLIRIIHPKSFIDDSTRIWRGLRYETRLGFRLETETLSLLKRDVPMLGAITGDRIYYELECVLAEDAPELILKRAGELGVLQRISASLTGDGLLAERFSQARALAGPERPSTGLYLALLAYDLDKEQKEKLIAYFNLSRHLAGAIRDTEEIKTGLPRLSPPGLKPSEAYHLLNGLSETAIIAGLIAASHGAAGANIRLYLDNLRGVKTLLTGDDLIRMGIPEGPRIKEMLGKLLDARLDGRVKTRADEERLVKDFPS